MARHVAREKWRRPLVVLVIVVVLLGVPVGLFTVAQLEGKSIRGGTAAAGDPGGKLLHELVDQLVAQIPLGAQIVSHHYEDSKWHNCSPGQAAGYSSVTAQIVFRSSAIPKVVASSALQLASASPPLVWVDNNGDEVTVSYATVVGSNSWIWTYDGSADAFLGNDPVIGFAAFCGGPS